MVNRSLHKLVKLHISRVLYSPNRTNVGVFRSIAASESFCCQVCELIWDDELLVSDVEEFQLVSHREVEDLVSRVKASLRRMAFVDTERATGMLTENLDEKEVSSRKEDLWSADTKDLDPEEWFDLYSRLFDTH